MLTNYMANINIEGQGGVVAAPDHNTPGGSYYYHWMRDAALTMNVYMDLHNSDYNAVKDHMEAYLGWVKRVQHVSDPNNIDVRTEPKFYLPEGRAYDGGWCRPQNDGPGLRALTLIHYADIQTS